MVKERILSFSSDDNPQIVELDKKKKESVLKTMANLHMMISHMSCELENDNLQEGMKNNVLSLLETYTVDILKDFDYESKLREEKERRCEDIRNLNIENRELRSQLGKKVSPEDVRECLKNIEKSVYEWWKENGFGYVSNFSFKPFGLEARFSCMFTCHYDETNIEKVKEIGYELTSIKSTGGEVAMLGILDNLKLFKKQLLDKFGDIVVYDVKMYEDKGLFLVRDITVFFRDYDKLIMKEGE